MPCDLWTFFPKTSSIFHLTSSIFHHPSYIIHLPSSGFSQLLDDSFHLSGRKRLAGGFVARRLQLLPELGAAANPTHQVAHGRAWAAVWEVHQGEFLLGVRSYSEIIHIGFMFQDSCFKSRRNEGKCKSHYSRTCVLTCALCFESLYFIISFEPFKGLIPFPIR